MKRVTRGMCRPVQFLLLLPALLMWSPLLSGAQAQQVRFVDVDGAFQTFLADVNESGTIVGTFAALGRHAEGGFVRSVDGTIAVRDYPGAYGTQVTGINNAGDVCGFYYDYNPEDPTSEFRTRAFIWRKNQLLPEPVVLAGATDIYLDDINDNGTAIGLVLIAGEWKSFVRSASGQFTFVTSPGGFVSLASIDNAGTVVGSLVADNSVNAPVRWAANTLSLVSLPVSGSCGLYSLTESGDMLGQCDGVAYVFKAGGSFSMASPSLPNPAIGLNSRGELIGSFQDGIDPLSGNLRFRGFFTVPTELVDPVPLLLDGPAVLSDAPTGASGTQQERIDALATEGRPVVGVAADGVARVVVRIPASSAGQAFTVRLLNDHEPRALSTSSQEDGALLSLTAQSNPVTQLTVNAAATTQGDAVAFVLYRAPEDFPRAGTPVAPEAFGPDDNKASRQVFLEITPQGGAPFTQVVEIVRPPVFLIHGLWSKPSSWFGFVPLRQGTDPRFKIDLADYSASVTVKSTLPAFSSDDLARLTAASLGVSYNTPLVADDMRSSLLRFRLGANPSQLPVAAVQTDVVAHSLGGIIARTMAAAPDYLDAKPFGAGTLHKLVTLDTPHLGSPIAGQLLAPGNSCLRTFVVSRHFLFIELANFSIAQATLPDDTVVDGAVGDLVGDPLSSALQRIASSALPQVSIAFVAGEYERWSALDGVGNEDYIKLRCGSEWLASRLTSGGWKTVFSGERNDAIVGWNSQINGLADDAVFPFTDQVHSAGTRALGFAGPSIQDGGAVPVKVIRILNTPVYVSTFYRKTP